MADGDLVLLTPGRIVAKLIDNAGTGATTTGAWVDCREYATGTITVIGALTTTQVEIDALNDLSTAPPLNSNNGVVATAAALPAGANAFVTLTTLPNYLKARIVATGTGTVTAIFCGRAFPSS